MLRILSILLLLWLPTASAATGGDIKLRHQIGQMLMVGFSGKTLSADAPLLKAIRAGDVGGVILFDYDFNTKKYDRNIESPVQLRALTRQLQAASHTPLLIAADVEGGSVNRLKKDRGFPDIPSAAAFSQLSDAKARQTADLMVNTLQQAGINLDFAPVLDVNLNPDNPVMGKLDRSYSSNPAEVVHFARIVSRAFHRRSVLCTYKHFPGHGSSRGDTHQGLVDITSVWQRKRELFPWRALLNQAGSCPVVMVAHIVHRGLDPAGYPATLSHRITTGLLRGQLHFRGVVVTDDLQMKAIADQYGAREAARLAIRAGADILLFGNQLVAIPVDPSGIVDGIVDDVRQGKISRQRIAESYHRILRLKRRLGHDHSHGI